MRGQAERDEQTVTIMRALPIVAVLVMGVSAAAAWVGPGATVLLAALALAALQLFRRRAD